MIHVTEPRTGIVQAYRSWGEWRAQWDRRPLDLAHRVRLCPWCWGYGGLALWGERTLVPVPCIGCGREGRPDGHHRRVPSCPTCGRPGRGRLDPRTGDVLVDQVSGLVVRLDQRHDMYEHVWSADVLAGSDEPLERTLWVHNDWRLVRRDGERRIGGVA